MPAPLRLEDRAILSVTGPDAETFLHGIITVSTLGMEAGARRHGALLTPQGKVIAHMFLERIKDGFLLDCSAAAEPVLLKRLTLFRLRAQVTVAQRDDLCVIAFAGAADPRSPRSPHRGYVGRDGAPDGDAGAYHAARIMAGVAEQGHDYDAEDVFPADINMDLTGGVDFAKGCFVGQEVVSRMKRRGTARRRTLTVKLAGAPPALPASVTADGADIGTLTSTASGYGLARLRIDRLAEAQAAGAAIKADGAELTIEPPEWLAAEITALARTKDGPA